MSMTGRKEEGKHVGIDVDNDADDDVHCCCMTTTMRMMMMSIVVA